MNRILSIYKPLGLTPYQLIQKLRDDKPELKDMKIGFAGRLDPLAHGVMLLMIGDATKERSKYLNFPKEYEFQILLGVTTDTYDALGYILNEKVGKIPLNLEEKILSFIKKRTGKFRQSYPPFSSIELKGKPLFQWAREGKLSEIKIPTREVEIYDFKLLEVKNILKNVVRNTIVKNINSVNGDFRQEETHKKWEKYFNTNSVKTFTIAKCSIHCSSGTYVRSIVNEVGQELGCGAIAYDILRTKVGNYSLNDTVYQEKLSIGSL